MDIDLSPPYYTPGAPAPPICTRIGRYIIYSNLLPEPTRFSYVYLCYDTIDKRKKVIKFIKLYEKKKERIKNEIEVMRCCNHKNIIQIQDFFRLDVYMCVVLPYAPHRSLWTFLQNYYSDGIPEDIAKNLFSQMLEAVNYLHHLSIWHRDIKPENFLIFASPPNSTVSEDPYDIINSQNITDEENDLYCLNFDINSIIVVLCDFGLSTFSQSDEKSDEFVGTFEYMAPELIKNNYYNKSIDIWALGITLYRMLTNKSPYPSTSNSYTNFMRKAEKGEINKRNLKYSKITVDATNLIDEMCQFDPEKRYTAEKALSHPWVKIHHVKSEKESEIGKAIGITSEYQFSPLF